MRFRYMGCNHSKGDLIFVAFTNYDQQHMPPTELFSWVGFSNFISLFGGGGLTSTFGYAFVRVLGWTLVWAFFATFTTYIGGILLSLLAVYFTLKSFNLTNSYAGLIMVYSASSGLGYLIAKGFFDTVPRALCEAARIDGCSEARIFFQMVLPMSRPIVVYTVISSFLVPWMDFVYAKMILNAGISSKYTVAIGLYKMLDKSLINSYFTQFCAGGVLVSIPISILFMIMQKFYVEGITGGAVKG